MATSPTVVPSTHTHGTITKPERLLSLDVLRGLTIGFMIMVNNNGGEKDAYWAMKHTNWNGFTPTDLVFPTFLFLVGISTVFSTEARLLRGESKPSIFWHTAQRAFILFCFGLLVNTFPKFQMSHLRVYGVLQRISVCYILIAALYLLSPGWKSKLWVAVAALAGYWLLMRFVPVPGFGTPTHEIPLLDHDKNLVAWLDRQIFSAPHLYEKTRDPEGLLSDLPALATALFGMLAGIWLRMNRTLAEKARGIALAGVVSLALGGLWNFEFPVNKKLWTSSYVLYAAGWSLLLLALSIWVVEILGARLSDAEKRKRYRVLLVFGTNAIAAYLFSELLPGALAVFHPEPNVALPKWLYLQIHRAIPSSGMASMVYCVAFVAVCWVAIDQLYRRRIFLKI
jgi:predicted acyltransferase